MTGEHKETTLDDFTTQRQDGSQNKNAASTSISSEDGDRKNTDREESNISNEVGHGRDSNSIYTKEEDVKFAGDLLEDERGSNLAENTVDKYISCIKQYIRHLHLEGSSLLTADVGHIRSFFKKCAEANLRESTISIKHSAIKKVYFLIRTETDQSTEVDLIEVNEIDINSYRTPPAIEREPLDEDEVEKLAEQLDTRDKLMVLIGLETGARNIDITKITLNQVDLDNREIELTDTKNNDTYTRQISELLTIELRQWIEVGRAAIAKSEQSDYLFPTRESKKISPCHFNTVVKSAAEDAGIQEVLENIKFTGDHREIFKNIGERTYHKVTPHALRHTLNVRLQKAGLGIEGRAAALNQESVSVNKDYSLPNTEYKDFLEELFD